jgi:hypothetical protein
MQPSGRLLVNIDGTNKSYILWNGTESYYRKLRTAYTDITEDKVNEYLYFGFFTLCASTLEYSLNFILTDYCVNAFGPEEYKTYAEGYISLPFGKKLLMIPHIVSGGKLKFNDDNSSYKNLNELISLRNKILHNKDFLKEFDFPEISENTKNVNFEIAITPNHIDTLTKDKCLEFGNSLGDFKKHIMTPALNQSMVENKMVIKS